MITATLLRVPASSVYYTTIIREKNTTCIQLNVRTYIYSKQHAPNFTRVQNFMCTTMKVFKLHVQLTNITIPSEPLPLVDKLPYVF